MPAKTVLFQQVPQWKDSHRCQLTPVDNMLESWLYETGSLTRRLRSIYGSAFAVEVLFNRWKPAFVDECQLLDLPHQRYQLIREVLLHAKGVPLILARTVLPEPTIAIAHRNLSHLGSRPLGEVIFSYPDLERRRRQISRVDAKQWMPSLSRRLMLDEACWGRRTVYAIHQQPLLVAEFFLPALFDATYTDR